MKKRTSVRQLRWIIRILFFPIWIWALRRRHLREITNLRCKCTINWLGEKITTECPDHRVVVVDVIETELKKIYKIQEKVPRHWALQLLDHRGCILDQEEAQMRDEDDGIVLYADFNIRSSMTIHTSRVLRKNKIVGTNTFDPIPANEHDIIKMRHALHITTKPEVKPEKIKHPELRRLQLLTANSHAVKDGTYPPNTFVLNDNGDMEDIGPEVRVKFHSWYPKAMLTKTDGSIEVSYYPDSELFQLIKEKADTDRHSGCMYGAEYVFELVGELVTVFFGTKSSRRASVNVQRVVSYEHILTSKLMHTKAFSWCAIEITPVTPQQLWMGEPIIDLDDKHLWNIVQAIKNGKWASGRKISIIESLEKALLVEFHYRNDKDVYSKKKIKKIKKQNKKYEEKFLKQTGKAYRA